jgi:hypothetical protein
MEEVVIGLLLLSVAFWLLSFWQTWALLIAFCALRYREKLAEFYYGLTPHPAEAILNQRLDNGAPIDGETFAEIMATMPGSRIEQKVRAAQAQKLAATARAALEANIKTLERMKAEAIKDAEFAATQGHLLHAVEMHERVSAQMDAVEEWRAANVR